MNVVFDQALNQKECFSFLPKAKANLKEYIQKWQTHRPQNHRLERTPAKAQPLITIGASHILAIASAAATSSILIICQLDKASVIQTLQQAPVAWAAKTIVDLTNGTPAHARETADWGAAHEAQYIHSGIMAVPSMIGQPHAMILYSGPAEVFEGVKDTLSALGTNAYVGDDVGLASLHDLALLSVMYGLFSGFTNTVALVQSADVPTAGFVATQLIPWLTAMTQHLNMLAMQVDEKDYRDGGSSLGMRAKAAPNMLEANTQNVSTKGNLQLAQYMYHYPKIKFIRIFVKRSAGMKSLEIQVTPSKNQSYCNQTKSTNSETSVDAGVSSNHPYLGAEVQPTIPDNNWQLKDEVFQRVQLAGSGDEFVMPLSEYIRCYTDILDVRVSLPPQASMKWNKQRFWMGARTTCRRGPMRGQTLHAQDITALFNVGHTTDIRQNGWI
ncbi:hypothetical protein ACJ73_00166 [Blastomyces percursus]|uniref:Uncharacterized protein n=1 Tax=Blastomyces percursus TaxID=1658174 RepID=A0A1J9QK16_9EURO|nr:hypothetical protein ACJ73_00166 [Blastomyces percursus]